MKIFALAVLLAVMQASPPIPRKATDSSTGASKDVQQKAASKDQAARKSTAPVETESTPDHNAPTDGQTKQNTEHSVTIAKLPPVMVNSPKRDWADWGTWGFNLLLVFVGALQVVLLCLTLRLIRHQAREATRQRVWISRQWNAMQGQLAQMERQTFHLEGSVAAAHNNAKAALLGAQAVINAERPWVIVTAQLSEGGTFRVHGKVIGRTSAIILQGWGEYPVTYQNEQSMPIEPPYSAPDSSKVVPYDLILNSEDEPFSIYEVTVANMMIREILVGEDNERDRLIGMKEVKFFWGKVVYADMLTKDDHGFPVKHETRWCYRYIPGAPGKAGFVVKTGKPAWNKCT